MADIKNKLNGGPELLAKAIQQVFEETMSATREVVREDLSEMEVRLKKDSSEMEGRLNKHLDERINTTDENMQAQFAEQEKKLGKLISEGRN